MAGLHMNAGNGESSYSSSSTFQGKVLLKAKPVLEDAIKKMLNELELPYKCFNMADLGCSSGPNTLFTVWNVIKIVQRLCHDKSCKIPEFQAFLNDLPQNDFNTVFESIPSFYQKLKDEEDHGDLSANNCFISGMPGSFYVRIFPSESLHLVHSSYSLHWLSQVPENMDNNKNNTYIGKTSPPGVFEAYTKQFEKDFSRFLRLRSQEIVTGGYMILTLIGRSIPDPYGEHCVPLEILSKSLVDLLNEGLIKQAELDTFNMPFYTPYKDEVKDIVEREGSFEVDSLLFFQVNWDERNNYDNEHFDANESGKHIAKTMRAVTEQLLVTHFHFGQSLVDYLFERYTFHVAQHLLVEKTKYFNTVMSLRKK